MLIGMGNPVQTLPISVATLREVDLIGIFTYANNYAQAIELLAEQNNALPDVTKLITHLYKGMANIENAFHMAARAKDDEDNLVLKVIIEMDD